MTSEPKTLSNTFQSNFNFGTASLSLIALGIALIAMSFAGIFTNLSEREISPSATIFHRFWTAFIVLWIWVICKARYWKWKGKCLQTEEYTTQDKLLLVATGITFWSWNFLWAWSLTQTNVTNSTLLHNLTSLFTCLGAWLLWKRQFDQKFIIGMILAIGGATVLEIGDLQLSLNHFVGDISALLSSIFYAANLMLIETLRSKFSVTTIILWSCSLATLLSLPILAVTQQRVFPISWQGWFFAISLGIICQLLGQGLVAYSLKNLSSAFVSLSELLEPVFTAIGAFIVFNEQLNLLNWLAFFVVLLGLYFATVSQSLVTESGLE